MEERGQTQDERWSTSFHPLRANKIIAESRKSFFPSTRTRRIDDFARSFATRISKKYKNYPIKNSRNFFFLFHRKFVYARIFHKFLIESLLIFLISFHGKSIDELNNESIRVSFYVLLLKLQKVHIDQNHLSKSKA